MSPIRQLGFLLLLGGSLATAATLLIDQTLHIISPPLLALALPAGVLLLALGAVFVAKPIRHGSRHAAQRAHDTSELAARIREYVSDLEQLLFVFGTFMLVTLLLSAIAYEKYLNALPASFAYAIVAYGVPTIFLAIWFLQWRRVRREAHRLQTFAFDF
jgi:hypothetical protein